MRDRHLPHLSFPEALGALFLEGRHDVVVAGTHGKTTTSTLTAWLLHHAGRNPSFLVGGVGQNLGDSARLGGGPHFVVEGDEYDTAYFDQGPQAPPLSADERHPHLHRARPRGHLPGPRPLRLRLRALRGPPARRFLAAWAGSERVLEVARGCPGTVETYAARDGVDADWTAGDLVLSADGARFELVHRGRSLGPMHLPVGGRHNVENALGAAAVATHLGPHRPGDRLRAGHLRGGAPAPGGPGRARGRHGNRQLRPPPHGGGGDVARNAWPLPRPPPLGRVRTEEQHRPPEPLPGALRRGLRRGRPGGGQPRPRPTRTPSPRPSASTPRGWWRPRDRGLDARHLPGPDAILAALTAESEAGDVVLVMSNGAFGGLPARLVEALAAR